MKTNVGHAGDRSMAVTRFCNRRILSLVVTIMLGPIYSGCATAEEAVALQQQIETQKAVNEALRAKIAKFEQVLKTDVCSNPEAAKLLEEEKSAPPPGPAKVE